MEAFPDATEVCLEKIEAVLKTSEEEVKTEIRTGTVCSARLPYSAWNSKSWISLKEEYAAI
jgi:hypothetical protein